ncbi:ferric uptake regulation protein (plasmid) [Nostoc sp. NIES-3756]|uniref:Fur family transcriptional regulator n=1 Tax=Nostoc sp. NIES-3756 TaxID=1751286 RepID=UPI0007202A22|nr:ferric uptake regulation protein [Nostoc sp. NIES-3756]
MEKNLLKTELKAKGCKYTVQREMILQIFQNLPKGNHLNADGVYKILKEDGQRMNLSTVYRNLKVMVNLGILREVALPKSQKHYEMNQGSIHHHIVCTQCHKIMEFDNYSILKQGWKQAEELGLELLDCQLNLRTVCSEALQMGWPTSLPNNWVCSRSISAVTDELLNKKISDSKSNIRKLVLCQIELKNDYIALYIIKDESHRIEQDLKLIEGWRFSRMDNGWYFLIEQALDVLDFLNGIYQIEIINPYIGIIFDF